MALSFVVDPPLTAELREEIVRLWTDVTNAGGAVGFVGPVTAADVRPVADVAFAGVTDGPDHLLAGFDDGRLVGFLVAVDNRFGLKAHWRVLKRVMVRPGSQGLGYGAALLREAAELGRRLGLEGLQVTVRDGHGLDRFYARAGYVEVGRIPGALRIGPGDDRDELFMWLKL
ncbi:GNAT family N-acetyltransferase [Actinoplanes sp. RD1]|uniref:GNAT family N-acetyltransferase n=1 Tax=Actinoplanes sp. RD1 TaxID=3064538 RepID=UPI002740F317|nr:GNAT family N-acetyltransferase [Actinoplanes sp. RD1]